MAPSAEKSLMTEHQQRHVPQPSRTGPPEKNMAVALNYELALVDQFLADTRKRRRKDSETDISIPIDERKTMNASTVEEEDRDEKKETAEAPSGDNTANGINRRMSMRDKGKRGSNLARTRIRYDFQMVPIVRRNADFLNRYRRWWMGQDHELGYKHASSASPTDNTSDVENKEPENQKVVDRPFRDDSTVVWIPSKRSDWEDCVSEMTAVCTQAAIRRHTPGIPFVQPLSSDYIRDRIDIDDPQLGYQLRHHQGGWLQGFILFTNFTTWNLGFRWDSRHPASGIPASNGILVDRSGSLSAELESQDRSGDTSAGGVVFPTIAEISLLGGLGCGEYLLRMALDDIRARGNYKFVVLQATTMSRSFYERFGFVRVGAICYFRQQVDNVVPLVGYRHWTHANESQKSLEKHGGPSYMMCLKLSTSISSMREQSFLQRMLDFKVEKKPFVENLGCGATPGPKSAKKAVDPIVSFEDMMSPNIIAKKKKPGPKSGMRKNEWSQKVSIMDSKNSNEAAKKGKKRTAKSLYEELTPKESTPKKLKTGRPRGRPPKLTPKVLTATEASSRRSKSTAKRKSSSRQDRDATTTTLIPEKNRAYHSVRGPDGRFVRVLMDENHQVSPNQVEQKRKRGRPPGSGKKKQQENTKVIVVELSRPAMRTSFITTTKAEKPLPLDCKKLKKQKVVSYPRDRPHFFNKVVRHKDERRKAKFYFVLEYDEAMNLMCLVPLTATGTLTGQRAGRPRYTCSFLPDDSNFEIVSSDDFEIIPATMIMKTPFVASEAWDIEES